MAWNIPLSCGQLSQLCLLSTSCAPSVYLLVAWHERQKRPCLCQQCSAIAETSLNLVLETAQTSKTQSHIGNCEVSLFQPKAAQRDIELLVMYPFYLIYTSGKVTASLTIRECCSSESSYCYTELQLGLGVWFGVIEMLTLFWENAAN